MKVFCCFAVLLLAVFSTYAFSWDLKVGDRFHITGCENGELLVPVVNMWSKPGGISEGARVIGKLSGDGRADQGLRCQGAVVKFLDIKSVRGRNWVMVESVVNGNVGWITDSFVGKRNN